MTVSYTGDVANGSSFGCFWKILGRWRGSVYKLIWRELVAYLCLYYMINFMYRFGLDEEQKTTFEKVKVYCRKNIESIPMSFVLGFYVSLIVKRWWDQYWILPMPDSLALYTSASIQGQDERGRLLRRTIMRYTMLSYIICLQRISFRVKKRFPTMQHLVDTGLMTESEMKIYEKMDQKAKVLKFWLPVVWASNLVNRARHEGRIQSDHMVQTILTEMSNFRRKLGRIMVFDNVSVPLVYTQVVTLAVYTYFVAALIGRQWVTPRDEDLLKIVYPGYNLDLYFPIFLSLQFIFYIGWLKVAETLINPFGEDDDDFELNWLIDRHIKVSYMVVDEMHEEHPELLKDQYWEQVVPQDLPYNIASERYRKTEPQGSTASLKVNPNESVYADLSSVKRHSAIPDDVYAEYESVAESPLADGRKNWLQRQLSRVESFRSTSSSSSLFGRNRANSAVAGGIGHPYHSHHRPSLYERLMNRRSSKDTRHSNRFHRPSSNSLSVPEKGFLPNSRPRVPTPDVTKENQIHPHLQITAASPPPMNKYTGKMYHPNGDAISSTMIPSPGYGTTVGPQNTVVYTKKTHTTPLKSSHSSQPPLPEAPIESTGNDDESASTTKGNNSTTTPPPPYDQAHAASPNNAMVLSTIAENDASPYSTNSTVHTINNSRAYPTTTSIFGRKPTPPPMDELPPIPSGAGSNHSNSNTSLQMEHLGRSPLLNRHVPYPTDGSSKRGSMEMQGRINEGYETDEGDDGRRYMTIAEVNECRAELEKKLEFSPNQQLPPLPPLIQKDAQRRPSDELVPLPITSTAPIVAEISPLPLRYGPNLIFRQDAVCYPDPNAQPTKRQPAFTVVPSGSTRLAEASIVNETWPGHSQPTKIEAEEDDGYHERVSYSEDDEGSNEGEKGNNANPASRKSSNTNPPSFGAAEGGVRTRSRELLFPYPSSTSSNVPPDLDLMTTDPHSVNTLKSNASDSDISHASTSSVDKTFAIPTRQKPVRRKRPPNDNSPPEVDNDNTSVPGPSRSASNNDITKDKEVFV